MRAGELFEAFIEVSAGGDGVVAVQDPGELFLVAVGAVETPGVLEAAGEALGGSIVQSSAVDGFGEQLRIHAGRGGFGGAIAAVSLRSP